MNLCYENTEQISKSFDNGKHIYPKYDKSTTDPTYYEPQASRIANMKKTSGASLKGIYDFYGDDLNKFSQDNFQDNISNVTVDPRFNNKLLREEVSQVVTDLGNKAQMATNEARKNASDKASRIDEAVATSKIIQNDLKNDYSNE